MRKSVYQFALASKVTLADLAVFIRCRPILSGVLDELHFHGHHGCGHAHMGRVPCQSLENRLLVSSCESLGHLAYI